MERSDLAKRDMTVVYGGRTFALRAYRDGLDPIGADWHAVIIENRTPMRNHLGPAPDPAACFAAAIRFLTEAVDATTGAAAIRG